ncbi:hypothetical protein EV424DRAFT_1554151 [Suillus variegatus]|nr:hypothetical protein EV424DRAFT_1554151 [Suillus variegatus]
MTVLNINKLSLYVLLLSVSFTQTLVVSAAPLEASDDATSFGGWRVEKLTQRTDHYMDTLRMTLGVEYVFANNFLTKPRCNSQSHFKTTHPNKHHISAKNSINMTVLNINKLSFYVLLLSVALAQVLAVSAAENDNLDFDDVTVDSVTEGLELTQRRTYQYMDTLRMTFGVEDVFARTGIVYETRQVSIQFEAVLPVTFFSSRSRPYRPLNQTPQEIIDSESDHDDDHKAKTSRTVLH